jgi:hypothetical protein
MPSSSLKKHSPVSILLWNVVSFVEKSYRVEWQRKRFFYCWTLNDLQLEGPVFPSNIFVFLCQRVNTAAPSPADDVHHYVIPKKLLLTSRFYFQQTSGIHAAVGKRKVCSLSGRSPSLIADNFHVATMARKHSVLNLRDTSIYVLDFRQHNNF